MKNLIDFMVYFIFSTNKQVLDTEKIIWTTWITFLVFRKCRQKIKVGRKADDDEKNISQGWKSSKVINEEEDVNNPDAIH